MAKKHENVEMTGLQFFGQISASISHEIKNVLAIINENAGLLEDFTLMADRGKPIDPARLKAMAATVKSQIGRADGIIKHMNRFAHSIDQKITSVNLVETIELFIALTARFAAMRSVQVDLRLPDHPVKFQTAPFYLMNLLWQCLDFCMSVCGDEKRIELVAEATKDQIRIRFRGLTRLSEAPAGPFPSERENYLLGMLAANLTTAPERHEMILRLSKNTDNDDSR
jgi:C4-dicarboxylate-specific signal transduction histidine kinase